MSVRDELLQEIEKQRAANSKKEKFSGNFIDYVELVKRDPDITKSAHKRLHDVIIGHSFEVMPDSDPRKKKIFGNENVKIYNYFKDHFFGMENVLAKLMSFLKSAAHKGEESRQVLLLMGPVGAGRMTPKEGSRYSWFLGL